MKRTISLCLVLVFVFLLSGPISTAQAASPGPGNEINVVRRAVTLSTHSLALNLGQASALKATLAPAFSNYSVSWSSSNESIATVTPYGLVIAKQAGTVTITALAEGPLMSGYIFTDTCTVHIDPIPVVEDGTYFIQTAQTNANGVNLDSYISIEGSSASYEATVEVGALSGSDDKKWEISLENDGYYRIRSVYSQNYLCAADGSSALSEVIVQGNSVPSSAKWSFIVTSSSNYALVPASSTSSLLVLNASGFAEGDDLNTMYYSSNTDYKDEWILRRMLPLSGYELDYSPNLWTGKVEDSCNCYAYAMNTQVYPGTNDLWIMPQMGEYKGQNYVCDRNSLTENNIIAAVEYDIDKYNSRFGTSLVFQEIGQYDTCPEGTYKVALVLSGEDYHWYRQDSDGLWSHKRGRTAVTRYDGAVDPCLIIDPQEAERGDYTTFVGYYAVTPWNGTFTDRPIFHFYFQGERYESIYYEYIQRLLNEAASSASANSIQIESFDISSICIQGE